MMARIIPTFDPVFIELLAFESEPFTVVDVEDTLPEVEEELTLCGNNVGMSDDEWEFEFDTDIDVGVELVFEFADEDEPELGGEDEETDIDTDEDADDVIEDGEEVVELVDDCTAALVAKWAWDPSIGAAELNPQIQFEFGVEYWFNRRNPDAPWLT